MKLILILLFIPLVSFGQKEKKEKKENDNPDRLASKIYSLEAEKIAPSNVKLPFSAIVVMDSRYDTTKIGFQYSGGFIISKERSFKKTTLKNGVAKSMQNYYNDYYQKAFDNSSFQLVICLKKFWFSNVDVSKNKDIDLITYNVKNRSMHCNIEYYLHKSDQYLPVKRIDTAWSINYETAKMMKEASEEKDLITLKYVLKGLVELYDFSKAITAFESQPKKTLNQIVEFNNRRFELNIHMDSIYAKGVFINFAEFKKNKPGIVMFKERLMKYAGNFRKEEFIENDKGELINPYWGYSNGVWIKFGVYGHDKLYKIQFTFEFFTKAVWYSTDSNSGSFPRTSLYRNEIWMPLQIDMETGNIY